MATFTTKIDRFDGGMVNDLRNSGSNVCRLSLGFNTNSVAGKLTPYRESEDGDNASSTSNKQNFSIALRTGTTYSLYGLGVVSGTGRAEILYKDLTTGGSNDLDDAAWSTPSNNSSATGNTSFNLFTYYARAGLIYGARSGTHVWAFSPGGSAFDNTHHALTHTNIAEGLVHSKDDILYIPYDNKIVSYDHGITTWNDTALTIPTHLRIDTICEFGNYLAIGARPLSGIGNSVVYLWDRDSSLTTLSEKIDWGDGRLAVLDELEDGLIGISLVGGTSTVLDDRVIFRVNGKRFLELSGTSSTLLPNIPRQKIGNRIFFMMSITIDSTKREGVWSIGRSIVGGPFSLVFERPLNNDTAVTSGVLYNFIYVDDFLFQAYNDNSAFAVSKTISTDTYTNLTATYITNYSPATPDSQRTAKKQLVATRVMFESLPSAGQVVLKYNVDGGADVTVFTEGTDSAIVKEDTIQSVEGHEYQFKLESTGGAVITSLEAKYATVGSQL